MEAMFYLFLFIVIVIPYIREVENIHHRLISSWLVTSSAEIW